MKESSRMPLFDLRKLNASLPVPSVPKSSIELLVLGAKDDFIVVSSDSSMFYCNFLIISFNDFAKSTKCLNKIPFLVRCLGHRHQVLQILLVK